jgi:exodeoxyribonuclease VII large subunit
MNQSKYLSVSELNSYINNIFRAEEMLFNITVLGEVSGFKIYGQHAYFTLKDAGAEIQCSCFNHRKTIVPKSGDSVFVTGSPNFYVKKGSLTFVAEKIRLAGQGELYVKLEELKNKLREEGLFDEAHKRPIPAFPNDVCVITSLNGAVIRDIVTTVRLRNNLINIKVYDVRVQGDGAAKTIIKALRDVDNRGYDVVIIARGGGSLEDLMPFNDEEVARTIFAMITPVISAVGHETDFTIADFTADMRAATPTAAAEIVAYNVEEWRAHIVNQAERMGQAITRYYTTARNRLNGNINLIDYQSRLILTGSYTRLDTLIKRAEQNIDKLYTMKLHKAEKLIAALDAQSPLKLLKSGYFKVSRDGMSVFSVKQLKKGDIIKIRGGDGSVSAEVREVEEKNEV